MECDWSMAFVLDESGINEVEFRRKVVSGRRVAGAIRSLVNAKCLQFECARIMIEALTVSVLIYGNEAMIWREKERSRSRAIQTDKH